MPLLQVAAAFVGTVAFSILFGVPGKHTLFCGLTGGGGWAIYLLVREWSDSIFVGTLVAACAIAALSRGLSTWRRTPSTMFLICGIFALVPGAGIYYTAYHLISGDNALALDKGLETFKLALMIALGIVIAYSLPRKLFGWKSRGAADFGGNHGR